MNIIDINEFIVNDNNEGVSIIMPFYNGIEFIEEAITSVTKQTYTKWELLIGVNGHPENSAIEEEVKKIISKYDNDIIKKIHIKYYNTKGAPATLNALANDSIYDLVAFLDADDTWEHTKLEKQIPYTKTFDVVGTHCRYIGNMNFCPSIPLNDISTHDIFKINPLLHSSILIKKELVNFEDHFVYDYNLWFKLFFLKKKFFNVPEILMFHRVHNNSAFNNNNQKYLEDLKKKWRNVYDE